VRLVSRATEKTGGHCKQRDNKNENENTVRTKSFGAMLLGIFSANHENMLRTNSHRTQKKKKRRKGRRLSRPFRPQPLIRGSGLCLGRSRGTRDPTLGFSPMVGLYCTHRYPFTLSLLSSFHCPFTVETDTIKGVPSRLPMIQVRNQTAHLDLGESAESSLQALSSRSERSPIPACSSPHYIHV